MRKTTAVTLAVLSLLGLPAGAAKAAELKQIATIPVPGEALASFDISNIDSAAHRYYLADRSNKAVDIFDTRTNSFVGRADGFIGTIMKNGKVNGDKSGPDGVIAIGHEIWAGDGDSTLKVVDAKTNKITDTISTGGTTRLDEMAYDSKNKVFIGVNNAEEPPYATLYSTAKGHRLIGKVVFTEATDGAEQPDWNKADGLFYVAMPQIGPDPKHGGVAVIDPRTARLVKMLPVENCHPNGLAFGPNQNFLLGCTAKGKDGMPPVAVIMNAKSGKVVATIPGIGGADMVAYSKKNNAYYFGGSNNPGGGVLGVIDAKTNTLVQKVDMKGSSTPHSVAVDDATGHVFVPGGAGAGGCSCIMVFGRAG